MTRVIGPQNQQKYWYCADCSGKIINNSPKRWNAIGLEITAGATHVPTFCNQSYDVLPLT